MSAAQPPVAPPPQLIRRVAKPALPAACTTVQVRTSPLPATVIRPVRAAALPFDATLKVTVPSVVSDAPPVIASHGTFVAAVHDVLAVTPMALPLAAALDRLVLAGLIARFTAWAACTTVTLAGLPLAPEAATTTVPVRTAVAPLAAYETMTVPPFVPSAPLVMASQDSAALAVYTIFPSPVLVTAKVAVPAAEVTSRLLGITASTGIGV